ncbi:MAG: hypothetical protein OZSIB_0565 [Candidatus Ozemobacter sibiricus]|uniref:Calcineurin-like phosphoesterase domain-containing protein n=1 Tax=Candidatus Ozemobacter sibiricus TaxID=2268124 RepID=A0A367ZLN1_9BACT|nr:MAG: hypothetical protein OZSIB_0565 [Candidatus Ozemobacter sibiricus]
MLLLITDVHCQYHLIDEQVAYAEQLCGQAVAQVVVLGDFGLFAHTLYDFFRRAGRRFARPVSFLEGNHEEFDAFADLVGEYRDCFTWLPRASVHTLDGHRVLALGGAAYMDAMTTPRGCEIRAEDIAACLALPAGSVDVVLSHDCPQGIGMTNAPGFGHFGPPGFAGGREIAAHLQPRLWIFGHHHRWFDRTHGATRYLGLPESWKGFALLGHHGDLRVIDHFLDSPSTFWSRLTTWCQRLLGRESS